MFPSIEVWNERFPKEPPDTLVAGVSSPVERKQADRGPVLA
jgi:hypothetical protein